MATEKTFLELVEFHERKWGTEQYPGRPALKELLNTQIVAMWRSGKRFMLSVHTKADELNELVTGLITGQVENPERRTLHKIYVNQEPIDFKIRIISNKAADQEQGSNNKSTQLKKEWKYPDQPTIVDTNPQRAMRDAEPYTPAYIPQLVERGKSNNPTFPGRKSDIRPGRNPEMLPGRKAAIIRGLSRSKNGKR